MIGIQNLKTVRSIGEGRFTKVCLVQDIESNQQLAMKVFKRQFSNEEEKESFSNSMINWSKIQDPALLSVSCFSLTNLEKENYPMFITDYFINGSLQQALDQKYQGQSPSKFTNSAKYIILLGTALGMKNLHSLNLYHGDLKPSNILLDKNYYPVISDFYISTLPELQMSNILSNSTLDSSFYTAPEVFKNSEITEKSDVYSFSLILYELIVGQKPYTGYKNVQTFREEIINGHRPEIIYFEDEDLKSFLSRCWSDKPTERPTFSDIYEELKSDKYVQLFEANEEDVSVYLKKFEPPETEPVKDEEMDDILDDDDDDDLDFEEEEEENFEKEDKMEQYFETGKTLLGGKMQNKTKALKYFKKAAELGHTKSMKWIGQMYLFFLEKNPKEALKYFKMAADAGDSEGMYKYADLLINGEGIPKNNKEAVEYLRKSADAGFIEACFKLGYILYEGLNDIPKNLKEAAFYLKYAADNGNDKAMFTYCLMVGNGEGVTKNEEESIHYLTMSAEKGNTDALFNLGNYYEKEKKDYKKAVELYIKSASKGNPAGMYRYFLCLEFGKGCAKDTKKAVQYLMKSAQKGYNKAMYALAQCLYEGHLVKKDVKESFSYLKRLVDRGDKRAINYYATILIHEKDKASIEEGIRIFKTYAEKDDLDCVFSYGTLLINGFYMEQNISKGMELIKKAALGGVVDAMRVYADLSYKGSVTPVNKREAANFYKMAADHGDKQSMINYGNMISKGDGICKNLREGQRYLKMAKSMP